MATLATLSTNLLSLILPSVGATEEVLGLRTVCRKFRDAIEAVPMRVTMEYTDRHGVQNWVLKNNLSQAVPAWKTLFSLNIISLSLRGHSFTSAFLETAFFRLSLQKLDLSYSQSSGEIAKFIRNAASKSPIPATCTKLTELHLSGLAEQSDVVQKCLQIFGNLKRLYYNSVDYSEVLISVLTSHPLEILQIYHSSVKWDGISHAPRYLFGSPPVDFPINPTETTLVSQTLKEVIEEYFNSGGDFRQLKWWLAAGGDIGVHARGKLELIAALQSLTWHVEDSHFLQLVRFCCFSGLPHACGIPSCTHSLLLYSLRSNQVSAFAFLLSLPIPLYSRSEDVLCEAISSSSQSFFDLFLQYKGKCPQRPLGSCNELCFAFSERKVDLGKSLLRIGVVPVQCKIHANVLLHCKEVTLELLRSGDLINLHKGTIYNLMQMYVSEKNEDAALELMGQYSQELDLIHAEKQYLLREVGTRSSTRCLNKPLAIIAIETGSERVFSELCRLGFDVTVKDASGWTTLMAAASYGDVSKVRRLLEMGASPNEKDKSNRVALHQAAQYGYVSVVQLLLDAQANSNVFSVDGDFPYDLALDNGHKEVMALLTARGAEQRRLRQDCAVA